MLYIFLSYMFMIGARYGRADVPGWNVLLAPVMMPMVIGKYLSNKIYLSYSTNDKLEDIANDVKHIKMNRNEEGCIRY